MLSELENLCSRYTDLSKTDISLLTEQSRIIADTPEYQELDVFIDVWNVYNNLALVVFHKPPKTKASLYREQIVGKKVLQYNEPAVFHTLETKLNSVDLLARSQERRIIRQRTYPILNDNNEAIGVTIVESDVSRTVLDGFEGANDKTVYDDISSALKLFGQLGNDIIDQLADAILVFNKEGYLVLSNKVAINLYKQLGYFDNIIGLTYDNLSLDGVDFLKIVSYFKHSHKNMITNNFNYLNYYFKEKKLWNTNKDQLILLIQDRTDIKAKEDEINSKSITIRETNHRIKNNLQSVISLLRLQQHRLNNNEAKRALAESISRIMAIASTYELMSKQLVSTTNLKAFIKLFISNFVQLNEQNMKFYIELKIDPQIFVNSDQIVSLAIIINEILQNVVSHAFNGSQKIKKYVQIEAKIVDNIITITVEDNGVGFDTTKVKKDSLGLAIINSYVKDKLSGRLKISSSKKGTKISFSFKQKLQH